MTAPTVLFVTDDRETYAAGNYYLAYQRAFDRQTRMTIVHPLDPMPDPGRFDLVVLGHAAIENYFPLRFRGSRVVPRAAREKLWFRHPGLRALRRTRTPTLLFTKNDYKDFRVKRSFIDYVRPNLVVTHTRSALTQLGDSPRSPVRWLPFGVDVEMFNEDDAQARPHHVGFRANVNTEWNGGERERFYRALARLDRCRPTSLHLAKNGEGFLVGKPYVEWMRSCTLLGNTISAAGTVGPRFLEAMACGTTPIAPRHAYEGLLVPDEHYVPVDAGHDGSFPGLEDAVAKYFDDPSYRSVLRENARQLVEAHTVDRQASVLRQTLGA